MRPTTRVCSALAALTLLFSACGDDDGGTTAVEPSWVAAPYVDQVDPFVGSGGRGFGYGSTVVGAVAPFGMVRLSPDTMLASGAVPFHHFSGYHYDDTMIRGFSHLHFHGTGAQGYGNLLMMPVAGFTPAKMRAAGYRSPFAKSSEVAKPGYYSARLGNGDILAELTTTGRVGVHRYTFPQGSSGAAVILDAGYMIHDTIARDIRLTIDPNRRTLIGTHRADGGLSGPFTLYWHIEFDQPLKAYGTWRGSELANGATTLDAPEGGGGAYLEFDITDGGVVQFRVGLSMVDAAGATSNLQSEAPTFDFDAIRTQTAARWDEMLGRIKIAEEDPALVSRFYTAAYQALITPTIYSDADGRYRGFDGQVHVADDFDYYSDLSLWDTFRTLHPWLTLVYPEVQRDIIVSLLKMYEQDGFLPIWPVASRDSGTMIGASAELVIADSYVKGLRNYDTALAYEAVTRSGREPRPDGSSSPGRRHVNEYLELGYVPYENDESSTSMTLEYAASDGALSQFAQAYGRPDDAAEFAARAQTYRNHWDPTTKFFRPKWKDGSFKEPFDDLEWGVDYREATAWQYLWYVPHDPQGLIELFGGKESFVAELEEFFEVSAEEHANLTPLERLAYRNYYWAGNEPDIHTAYLFNDAGRPDLAGKWARWALDVPFGNGPDGLPGNDDCGTMATWYLFTSLGFYPVPGYDTYYVGTPLYDAAEIQLADGSFRILAPGAGPTNVVPNEPTLDGRALSEYRFRHTDIMDGGELRVRMTPES